MSLNPSSRRAARGALSAVALLGAAIALSPALQHAYGWWSQRQLRAQWEAASLSSAKAPAVRSTARPKHAAGASSASKAGHKAKSRSHDAASAVTLSAQTEEPARAAAPLPPTQLSIPEIGVDAIVVQGLDAKALAQGPGHDPNSALPGQKGNCVLAAHRNVYGSWFYNLDQLWAGSSIELRSAGQTYHYAVVSVQSVPEADTSVLRSRPEAPATLTLITCTLPHSPYRLVATAYLQNPEGG